MAVCAGAQFNPQLGDIQNNLIQASSTIYGRARGATKVEPYPDSKYDANVVFLKLVVHVR